MQVIKTSKNEVFSWCPVVEENALNQIKAIADLPFVFKHCALMPDAHMGQEMPIGGVVATNGIIVPNFVGVDIGCGMCAIQTSLKAEELTDDKRGILHHSFERSIPVGFSHNDQKRVSDLKQKYSQKVDYIFEKTNIEMTKKILSYFNLGEDMIEKVSHRKGHDFRYSIDGTKLKQLGFKYLYNDLNKEINELCKWYKENENWWRPIKK